MPKRPKIGDIIEIETSKGKAYSLHTHKHPRFGSLMRVFSDLHSDRPADFETVAKGDVAFSTFFPLGVAVHRGIFEIVSNQPAPISLQQFPLFRNGNADRETNKVSLWWLWDGEKEWKVGPVTDEIRQLNQLAISNDTSLIYKIETGYRPENDPYLEVRREPFWRSLFPKRN